MAAQFDFIAGIDISSLSSVTQAQLMQMINQIAPLSNIGGVIVQAGTSVAGNITQGTNGSPSVADNPRFARYIWLNTHNANAAPTPYYYNANNLHWISTNVAAGSITNAEIASNAAIAVAKLAKGTASYLLRTDSSGNAVEYANPANIFTNNTVPVIGLQSNGTPAYLKTNSSGNTVWVSESSERTAIQNNISALYVSQLYGGSNGNILYSNVVGVPTWGAPSTAFGTGSNIPLNALASGGATERQLMHYSGGGGWAPITPSLQINSSANISTVGMTSGSTATTAVHTFTHNLLALPKLIRVVLKCTTADSTFSESDEVDAANFVIDTGSVFFNAISVTARSTNTIIVAINQTASFKAVNSAGAYVAIVRGSWTPKVYAWA